MKITKEFDGIKTNNNGDYVFDGDLISDESIEIELGGFLFVTGSIVSKKNIKSANGIKAGWGIKAGEGIKAGTFICTKNRIFAGISAYMDSKNCEKTIKCAELRSGEICYGDMKFLKPMKITHIKRIETVGDPQ